MPIVYILAAILWFTASLMFTGDILRAFIGASVIVATFSALRLLETPRDDL